MQQGVVHDDLRLFLETNLPIGGGEKAAMLGVGDAKIGGAGPVYPDWGASPLPLPGKGADCPGCLQNPTRSGPQLLQGQVQRQQVRQHDHPVHCPPGPAGQGHQHVLHACAAWTSPIDLINIERFSNRVVSLASYRLELQEYLRSEMSQLAPNLAALIGDVVGARLSSHAGSLAKYPASTVQILGAEKALFRALKTRGNTPKYGLIFHSTFIGRAAAKNKGRISCYLANKCTIASRIDTFSEVPTCVFGDQLRDQVEERLSFYEMGEAPRKNLDVMKEAVIQAGEVAAEIKIRLEKREKKRRKREKKLAALSTGDEEVYANGEKGECDVTVVKKEKEACSRGSCPNEGRGSSNREWRPHSHK
nr:nucleolar protein 56-like [Oncorhynchus nerka]